MRYLIERLRNDTLDDISDTALEAADALERLTAGDVELPEPMAYYELEDSFTGYSKEQLKDYGDQRASAARLNFWEKQEPEYYGLYQQHTWLRVEKKQFDELKPGHRIIRYANPNEKEKY